MLQHELERPLRSPRDVAGQHTPVHWYNDSSVEQR